MNKSILVSFLLTMKIFETMLSYYIDEFEQIFIYFDDDWKYCIKSRVLVKIF